MGRGSDIIISHTRVLRGIFKYADFTCAHTSYCSVRLRQLLRRTGPPPPSGRFEKTWKKNRPTIALHTASVLSYSTCTCVVCIPTSFAHTRPVKLPRKLYVQCSYLHTHAIIISFGGLHPAALAGPIRLLRGTYTSSILILYYWWWRLLRRRLFSWMVAKKKQTHTSKSWEKKLSSCWLYHHRLMRRTRVNDRLLI